MFKFDFDQPLNAPKLQKFFKEGSEFLKYLLILEGKLSDTYFEELTIDMLKTENQNLYFELFPAQYTNSYANPIYTAQIFGKPLGQVIAYMYSKIRACIPDAYSHRRALILNCLDLFERMYETVLREESEDELEKLMDIIKDDVLMRREEHLGRSLFDRFSKENIHFKEIVTSSDLSDLRYLYKYGVYISDYEIQTARFLQAYDSEKLDQLASTIVNAYIEGFRRDNKDITVRHSVQIVANVGQEHLTKRIIENLLKHNLFGFISRVCTTEVNKQYDYDHKFDNGLYLDEALNEIMKQTFAKKCLDEMLILSDYSGILLIEKFGEMPFSPVSHEDRVKLTEAQQKLSQDFDMFKSEVIEEHMPETERSFCIVAFPSPEIGDAFEAIFEDIMAINMLDSAIYETIQQKIIDALDQGIGVLVKGKKDNQTDIFVKLQNLEHPLKQTNFVNCVADVNIPVGEVFTSPELKGTHGVLHVDTIYLDDFNYENLKLVFNDGVITEYSCTNFEDEEKNKEYIRENLLFPHYTLPIGEFAIGTNTLAYVISEKYGIVDKLPVLIVEKMGPHFAIGDTCFSWAEDNKVYNSDGKEITARDNERSILRKQDPGKAYTNCHTDITIPYDSIEKIAVILKDGHEILIIKDGRFVLEGTEVLNEPFED